MAEYLLQNGANAQQAHFLGHEINLVPMENVECLRVLLKYGADVNSISRSGFTPLMKASKEGWVCHLSNIFFVLFESHKMLM